MIDFKELREFMAMLRLAESGEDIFSGMTDFYLNRFINHIVFETIDSSRRGEVQKYMLNLSRDVKVGVCKEYFLKKQKVHYAHWFGLIVIGELSFQMEESVYVIEK